MTAARWRPAALWALLIEVLVLWPNPPEVPREWALSLPDVVQLDKLVHGALFTVMAVLLLRASSVGARARWWVWAFVACAAFGAFTELQQHFVPTRDMELGDFLADAAGSALGLAIFAAWALRRRELNR